MFYFRVILCVFWEIIHKNAAENMARTLKNSVQISLPTTKKAENVLYSLSFLTSTAFV